MAVDGSALLFEAVIEVLENCAAHEWKTDSTACNARTAYAEMNRCEDGATSMEHTSRALHVRCASLVALLQCILHHLSAHKLKVFVRLGLRAREPQVARVTLVFILAHAVLSRPRRFSSRSADVEISYEYTAARLTPHYILSTVPVPVSTCMYMYE